MDLSHGIPLLAGKFHVVVNIDIDNLFCANNLFCLGLRSTLIVFNFGTFLLKGGRVSWQHVGLMDVILPRCTIIFLKTDCSFWLDTVQINVMSLLYVNSGKENSWYR